MVTNRKPRDACSSPLSALVVASFVAVLFGGCASTRDRARVSDRLEDDGRFELVVLGIAQDGGLPHVGCDRECCSEARRVGHELYPTALGVFEVATGRTLLVEATPRVGAQLALLDASWRLERLGGSSIPADSRGAAGDDDPRWPVDAIAITHAHIGHYSGLIQFGREVASTRSIPTHVSPRMAEFLRKNGPWNQLVELDQIDLQELSIDEPFEPLPGLEVTAIAVPHRDEYSDTVAFRLRGSQRTILFVPDIDGWRPGLLEKLIDGVDYAYVDGTFYDGRELPGRDLSEIPHPLMVTTMARLTDRAAEQPGHVRFIHLNHTNPALHERAIRADLEARGFGIAERGERLRF